MIVSTDAVPDPARADLASALFGTWRVGTPERQRATIRALVDAWEKRPWPHPGLLSYNAFTSTDGDVLLHYSQWARADSYQGFLQNRESQTWKDEVDKEVPGIVREGVSRYRFYRRHELAPARQPPGCFVTVTVDLDDPGLQRQDEWVDGVVAAATSDPRPAPGLLAAYFHCSDDGTRVLNLATWTSERAHADALSEGRPEVGSAAPEWTNAHDLPKVRTSTCQRFLPGTSLVRP